MLIRRLTMDDYDEIVQLWNRASLPYKPEGRDSIASIASEMEANPGFFIGAFEGNRLVGTVIASWDLRKGWVNRLAVDPMYQRRGVAKTLITEAEKVLRKRGAKIICALIEDYNSSSMELFKKCGYIEDRGVIYFSKRESNKV
jgi:predicted N-acetyltransferase YhbS